MEGLGENPQREGSVQVDRSIHRRNRTRSGDDHSQARIKSNVEVKALQLKPLLQAISSDPSKVSEDVIKYLVKNGLVETLTEKDFRDLRIKALSQPEAKKLFDHHSLQRPDLQSTNEAFTQKLKSPWHALGCFFTLRWAKRGNMRKELSTVKDLQRYKPYRRYHVRATHYSKNITRLIAARRERLQDVDSLTFIKEYQAFRKMILKSKSRFISFWNELDKRGFAARDQLVINYGMSLSVQQGEQTKILKRAAYINSKLWNNEWKEYRRLAVVSSASTKPGKIEDVYNSISQIFVEMINQGHKKCYSTWLEAVAIHDIPLKTSKEKISRFEKVRTELAKVGWKKGSSITCFIAAKLAKNINLSTAQLARLHRTVENKIVALGRKDCKESGLAALVLLLNYFESGKTVNIDKSVQRFNKTFELMSKYKWSKNTEWYLHAAIISLMPGTIEENVQLVSDTINDIAKLKIDENRTMHALMLVGSAYGELLDEDATPDYISAANFNSELLQQIIQMNQEASNAATMNLIMMSTATNMMISNSN